MTKKIDKLNNDIAKLEARTREMIQEKEAAEALITSENARLGDVFVDNPGDADKVHADIAKLEDRKKIIDRGLKAAMDRLSGKRSELAMVTREEAEAQYSEYAQEALQLISDFDKALQKAEEIEDKLRACGGNASQIKARYDLKLNSAMAAGGVVSGGPVQKVRARLVGLLAANLA